ncbi:hypothetical protein CC2G_011344 [Coprinopsis cinerea AmutBmut pab1-1]|nr:hypothetical protein CC2G_011344 [Coprinopsis cinerea AmutBmut pab1-1]
MSRDNQQEAVSRGWRVSLSNSLSNHSSISLSPLFLNQAQLETTQVCSANLVCEHVACLETSSKSKPVHDDYWSETLAAVH